MIYNVPKNKLVNLNHSKSTLVYKGKRNHFPNSPCKINLELMTNHKPFIQNSGSDTFTTMAGIPKNGLWLSFSSLESFD